MSILSQISRLKNAKVSIKTAIENKGVTVGSGTIDTYASKIDEINTEGDYFGEITETQYAYMGGSIVKVIKKIPENLVISSTHIDYLFEFCSSITTIPNLNLSSVVGTRYMFNGCTSLTSMSNINLPELVDAAYMFNNCNALTDVPALNAPKLSIMQNMFLGCTALSESSLNNILSLCANSAVTTEDYKTLKYIGLTESQATKCTTLSNYQAFLNAGWTMGY